MGHIGVYDRQKDLDLKIPESAMIVGCGGIGFWASLFLGMSGVKKLYLVDEDTIQVHNLNRLPVRLSDVGRRKVDVLKEMITSIRQDAIVISIPRKFNPLLPQGLKPEIIIDATDDFNTQKEINETALRLGIRYIRAGYDGGTRITITSSLPKWDLNPSANSRYEVIPSWVAPAVIAGALAVVKALMSQRAEVSIDLRRLDNEKLVT